MYHITCWQTAFQSTWPLDLLMKLQRLSEALYCHTSCIAKVWHPTKRTPWSTFGRGSFQTNFNLSRGPVSCALGLALLPSQGKEGGRGRMESVNLWCDGDCGRTSPCLSVFLWQKQEPLCGGHPLWHQRGPAALGSWACELPQVIRERLEKTVTRKEISREGRSNKALNNGPSVESHWGHRPRD